MSTTAAFVGTTDSGAEPAIVNSIIYVCEHVAKHCKEVSS
jgi:hypothetical protein